MHRSNLKSDDVIGLDWLDTLKSDDVIGLDWLDTLLDDMEGGAHSESVDAVLGCIKPELNAEPGLHALNDMELEQFMLEFERG
jgi:hypothetical protein